MAYVRRVRRITRALDEVIAMSNRKVVRASELKKGDVVDWRGGTRRRIKYVGHWHSKKAVTLRVDQHWGDDEKNIPPEIELNGRCEIAVYT